MKTRKLGDIVVPEIGMGCWGIGGGYYPVDRKTARETLEEAFISGTTFFDTAPMYGDSESLLGETFSHCRSTVQIATKTRFGADEMTYDKAHDSFLRSLDMLKTDYIDLLQLHNPPREIVKAYDLLFDLKQEGLIREFGVSVASPEDAVWILNRHTAPVIQINFNLQDTRAVDCGLLDLAAKKGVGVIARTPLGCGKLAEFSSRALRFCLSFDQISCVIPGSSTPRHASVNASACDDGYLPEQEVREVVRVNQENEYYLKAAHVA